MKDESSKTLSKLGCPAVDGQSVMKSLSQDFVYLWSYMEGDQILLYVSISSGVWGEGGGGGLLLLGLHWEFADWASSHMKAWDCCIKPQQQQYNSWNIIPLMLFTL